MKLTVVLTVLIGTLVLARSTVTPVPAEPTPNIDATVEARVAQERAVDATVEARLKEEWASQPTVEAQPTNTQSPSPTNTSIPQPTNTFTLGPSATSVPTPTPRPVSTKTPIPSTPTRAPTGTPNPTRTPTPTPIPIPGYALYINGPKVYSGDISVAIPYGTANLHQLPDADDTYRENSWVNLSVTPTNLASVVRFSGGFQTTSGTSGSINMDYTKWVTISITPPVPPTLVPTATIIPTPTLPLSPTSTPSPNPGTSQSAGDCDYTLLISDGDNGLIIRFKIGTTWANETSVWQQGEAEVLDLTVSSVRIPYHSNFPRPISFKVPAVITRFLAQSPPPHVVVGSADASTGTPVTAWINGEKVASTNCN